MAAVIDIVQLKRRVAETETKPSAAPEQGWAHNPQLLDLLEAVERTLMQNQQQIRHLEEKQDHGLEGFQQLRELLRKSQMGPPHLLWRCLYPKSFAARADLSDRLDAIIATMKHDDEEGAKVGGAKDGDTALARRRRSKLLVLLTLMIWPVALALVAYKVNSSLPFHLVKRRKIKLRKGGARGRGI